MKKYFADTNFYLRFILQDNKKQADKVETQLKKAEIGKKRIVFLSAVILEMAFVLHSNYSLTRTEITKNLLDLVKTAYLEIEDKDLWMRTLPIYAAARIDLIDIFLFMKAKASEGEVLSFDEDFRKLKRLIVNRAISS